MKKGNIKRISFYLSVVMSVLFITSCSTSSWKGSLDPFGVVGPDSDIYIYLPVAKNKDFLKQLLDSSEEKRDIMKALNKTKAVYAGISLADWSPVVHVCTQGSYPFALTDVMFPNSKGWQNAKTESGYKYYESGYFDVSIPSPLIACVLLGPREKGGMNKFLNRLDNPQPPQFSPKFSNLINSGGSEFGDEIGVYMKDSDFFVNKILGLQDMQLPFGSIELYLKKKSSDKNAPYTYYAAIENKNEELNFTTRLVLERVLNRVIKANVSIQENFIIIDNGTISTNKLVNILQSLTVE